MVVSGRIEVDHAHVDCQDLACFPGWEKDIRIPLEVPCCRLLPAMWNSAGLQTPAQEILNDKMSLPELVPFVANHVVSESFHRCAAGNGQVAPSMVAGTRGIPKCHLKRMR